MLDNLAADTRRLKEIKTRRFPWYVLESLLFENGYQAVLFYRAASWFRARGIPVLGPFLARLGLLVTGADISPAAAIGPGLRIAHGQGIVVGGAVKIGRGALLLQQVTIGARSPRQIERMPVVGDGVFIGAGAFVIGPITVGDDVFIGAGALVSRDVPAHSKVVSTAGIEVQTRTGGR